MIDWHTTFTVMCISRYALRQTKLTEEEIAQLSDEDMEHIAEEMDIYIEDYYFDKEVWSNLEESARKRLELNKFPAPYKKVIRMRNPLLFFIYELLDAAGLRETFENEAWFRYDLDRSDGLPLSINAWPSGDTFCGEHRQIRLSQAVFVDNSPDGHNQRVCDPSILITDTGQFITLSQLCGENCIGFDLKDDKSYVANPEEMEKIRTFALAWVTLLRLQGWLELAKTGVQSCQFPRSHGIDIAVFYPLSQETAAEVPIDLNTNDFWQEEFSAASITRENLISHGFSREIVETLTDTDMQEIASAMEDVYFDHGYWEDLALCANQVLAGKQEETDILTADTPEGETYDEPTG